jgi:hypothetical protein
MGIQIGTVADAISGQRRRRFDEEGCWQRVAGLTSKREVTLSFRAVICKTAIDVPSL